MCMMVLAVVCIPSLRSVRSASDFYISHEFKSFSVLTFCFISLCVNPWQRQLCQQQSTECKSMAKTVPSTTKYKGKQNLHTKTSQMNKTSNQQRLSMEYIKSLVHIDCQSPDVHIDALSQWVTHTLLKHYYGDHRLIEPHEKP